MEPIDEEIKCPLPGCEGILIKTYELRCNKCKDIYIEMDCPNPECDGIVYAAALGGEGVCQKCGEPYETSFDTNFGTIFEG